MEIFLDPVVGIEEERSALVADLVRYALQVRLRLLQVSELSREEIVALLDLRVFLGGHEVDGTQILQLLPERGQVLPEFDDGRAYLEHARLELHEIARELFGEVFLDIAYFRLGLRESQVETLELALQSAQAFDLSLEVFLALGEIGILDRYLALEPFELRGELPALLFDVGYLAIEVAELFLGLVQALLFEKDFVFELLEEAFLTRYLTAQERQRLLRSGALGLHAYAIAAELF